MKTLGRVRLRSALPLVSDNSARAWVEFAYAGEWKGYHGGAFTFDKSKFNSMIRNFNAQANPLPLTYEHPEPGNGQPVPAAGWIHALELRGDSLWGYCEFTPRAADMIKNGEYRFCSVVVSDESIDRVSGEEAGPTLFEVGLTNSPFLDDQIPIRLSAKSGEIAAPVMAPPRMTTLSRLAPVTPQNPMALGRKK